MSSRRCCPVLLTAVGVVLAGLAGPAAAPAAAATPLDCPAPYPLADVGRGLQGTGYTVTVGRRPQAFAVEVLGTLKDALGPGRDLILIRAGDLPGQNVIGQGAGIWAGMSGSPVYVDGKLLGAVSYALSFSPSSVAGVTPAADMYELLDPSAAASASTAVLPDSVTVPRSMLGERADGPAGSRVAAAAPVTLHPLAYPLAVTGLGAGLIDELRRAAEESGLDVLPYAAGASPEASGSLAPSTIEPGGNFAAALAYGDFTAAAIGTTTAVCDHQALAFGHAFTRGGPSTYGAHDADALLVLKDDTFGSFKMANLGPLVGTVTDDRTPGIRAALGTAPRTIPVRTFLRLAGSPEFRRGGVQVTDDRFLPIFAQFGVLSGWDVVDDRTGPGSVSSSWWIEGTRAGGRSFTVGHSNRWTAPQDVISQPATDLALTLDALLHNPYEDVTIRRVRLSATGVTEQQQLRIVAVETSVGGGEWGTGELHVRVGDTIRVRTTLQPYQSLDLRTVVQEVVVPEGAAGGTGVLVVTGGGLGEQPPSGDPGCLMAPTGCAGPNAATTLDQLLRDIRRAPTNDRLSVSLQVGGPDGAPAPEAGVSRRLDQVTTGELTVPVTVGDEAVRH